jgi:hypothetical protein
VKSHQHEKQTRARLPILIRYRAQDYETRYLDDPRVLYIEEYRDLHRDDGFVAMIPSEKVTRQLGKEPGWKWWALGWAAMAIASLSWNAYQLISTF